MCKNNNNKIVDPETKNISTQPLCHEQKETQGQFFLRRVQLGLIQFSFSLIDCLIKAKESNLPYYLPIEERRDGFILSPKALV